MEPQTQTTSELDELRQVMTPDKPTPKVLELLGDPELDRSARYLALALMQDDNHVAVLAGVLRRFYDALETGGAKWIDRQQILVALNSLSDRLEMPRNPANSACVSQPNPSAMLRQTELTASSVWLFSRRSRAKAALSVSVRTSTRS